MIQFFNYLCGMNTKLPYCKTSESVKGYNDSKISSLETNDCVVRAIASSFDVTYDESHKFCKDYFKRKNRKGVMMFVTSMERYINNDNQIFGKTVKLIGKYSNLYYDVKVKNAIKKRALTVGKFIKENQKGTFLVSVSGHAFAIKDGVVMGNIEDAQKTKRVLQSIWKIA